MVAVYDPIIRLSEIIRYRCFDLDSNVDRNVASPLVEVNDVNRCNLPYTIYPGNDSIFSMYTRGRCHLYLNSKIFQSRWRSDYTRKYGFRGNYRLLPLIAQRPYETACNCFSTPLVCWYTILPAKRWNMSQKKKNPRVVWLFSRP